MTSKSDELTGLKSAEQFRNKVEQYMAYSSVASPYALLILDIVNFKQVNEQYGHMFGDNVLVQVADTLIDNINPGDYAGGLGGDEFVLFLRNVSEDAVNNLCDRLCRQIRNIYVGENILIDANIGAVVSSDPTVEYMNLLQTADIALGYLSEEGVNGVRILKEIATGTQDMTFSAIYERDYKSSLGTKEKRLSELIFELLEQAKDIDKAIGAVLALVGEKRKVSRIRVMSYKDGSLEPVYSWAARGIGLPENVDGTVMRRYIDSHRDSHDEHDMSEGMGLIDENTIQGLSLREVNSLLPFDAKSMIYSEIMENGEYTGMVEYVDCTGDRVWDTNDFKAFKTVSRLIGAFTVKGKAIKNMSVDKA